MEKKITMDEFINRYSAMKSDEAKKNYLKSLIKQSYCPIAEKYGVLQVMIDKSTTTQSDGLQYIDMFIYRINLAMAFIIMYTDISIGEKTAMDYYDFLNQNHIIEWIQEFINNSEINEIATVSSSLITTFENKNSFSSYVNHAIETYITLFAKIISDSSNKLADVLSDKTYIDNIIYKIHELTRK